MVDRYSVATVQFDSKSTVTKSDVKENLSRVLLFIDNIMEGYKGYCHPIKFVVFPEFATSTYSGENVKENMKVADTVPGEITDALGEKAKQYRIYITLAGIQEVDPKWKGAIFNCAPLIGPDGKVVMKYRKANPYVPAEIVCSPHDLIPLGYDEPIFPVAKTPLGNIGIFICYDGMFPEVGRQLAFNGAEVLVRPTACVDPFGTIPLNLWEITNVSHAISNLAYLVYATICGSRLKPFTWSSAASIIDYQGRYLSRAPEAGEHVVIATIDIDALRSYRKEVLGHQMLPHLRTELYNYLQKPSYPMTPKDHTNTGLDYEKQFEITKKALRKFYKLYYG